MQNETTVRKMQATEMNRNKIKETIFVDGRKA